MPKAKLMAQLEEPALSSTCHQCRTEYKEEDSKNCKKCGTRRPHLYCPCGTKHSSDSLRCRKCGKYRQLAQEAQQKKAQVQTQTKARVLPLLPRGGESENVSRSLSLGPRLLENRAEQKKKEAKLAQALLEKREKEAQQEARRKKEAQVEAQKEAKRRQKELFETSLAKLRQKEAQLQEA